MRYGAEDLGIEASEPSQLLGIDLVALAIAVRNHPQLANVRQQHFVAQLLEAL
jgi:hypothetical protein